MKISRMIAGAAVLAAAAVCGFSCGMRQEPTVHDTVEIGAVSSLSVDVTSADIIIRQGSSDQVSYDLPESLKPEITQDGSKLTIVSKSSKKLNWVTYSDHNRIEITLSAKTLESVGIKATSGNIQISDTDVSGSINVTSGDITISGSKSGGDLKIKSASGDLKIDDCIFGKLTTDQTSGDMRLTGTGSSRIETACISGDVSMELSGSETDFDFDISATSGKIIVGGAEIDNSYKKDNGSGRAVDISTTSGDILVSFT